MQTNVDAQCYALHRWFTCGRKFYHYVVHRLVCKLIFVLSTSLTIELKILLHKKDTRTQQYYKTS